MSKTNLFENLKEEDFIDYAVIEIEDDKNKMFTIIYSATVLLLKEAEANFPGENDIDAKKALSELILLNSVCQMWSVGFKSTIKLARHRNSTPDNYLFTFFIKAETDWGMAASSSFIMSTDLDDSVRASIYEEINIIIDKGTKEPR